MFEEWYFRKPHQNQISLFLFKKEYIQKYFTEESNKYYLY